MADTDALAAARRQLPFWAGQVSQLGTHWVIWRFPVIAVVLLGTSKLEVGVLNASATAAFLIVGLPAGTWGGPLAQTPRHDPL